MSEFKVKTQALRSAVNEEDEIQKRIYDIYEEVTQQKNSISFNICVKANIEWRLTRVSNGINKEYRSMQKMQQNLARVADLYEKTENTICKVVEDGKVTAWENLVNNDLTGGMSSWTNKLLKERLKAYLDIIPQFGCGLGVLTVFTELAKILMDGDGWSAKDFAALTKGVGKSWSNLLKLIDKINEINKTNKIDKIDEIIKDIFGLTKYKNLTTDAISTYGKSFLDELNWLKTDNQTGAVSTNYAKVCGWAFTFLANGISNYEEYQDGGISVGRAVTETFLETGIDIVKGAAITAAVAAGAAAIGVSAPAVVVAGVGVVVSAGLDFVCKKITGAVTGEEKGLTETISDGILDFREKVIGEIAGALTSSKKPACSWAPRLGYA